MIPDRGWQAHIVPTPMWRMAQLYLFRDVGDEYEQITRIGTSINDTTTERFPAAETSPLDGFWLPPQALEAIAEAVRPGPTSAELARLEDALAVERTRVDRTLAALHTPASP